MSIAGHVSRAMLSRYSHVRMEAKRRALDEIALDGARLTRSAMKPARSLWPRRKHPQAHLAFNSRGKIGL